MSPSPTTPLETALHQIVNKFNLRTSSVIIKSAGFIQPRMISKNALSDYLALYLRLPCGCRTHLAEGERKQNREALVRDVASLTGRHSGSFEGRWEQDIRHPKPGCAAYLKQIESELSDSCWTVTFTRRPGNHKHRGPYSRHSWPHRIATGLGDFCPGITVTAIRNSPAIHHIVPRTACCRRTATPTVAATTRSATTPSRNVDQHQHQQQTPSVYAKSRNNQRAAHYGRWITARDDLVT